jgi:hypothetical protein
MNATQPNTTPRPTIYCRRALDFTLTGEYIVTIGATTVTMFRDRENGWWYEANTNKHYSQCVLGFSKTEALMKIAERELLTGDYSVEQLTAMHKAGPDWTIVTR